MGADRACMAPATSSRSSGHNMDDPGTSKGPEEAVGVLRAARRCAVALSSAARKPTSRFGVKKVGMRDAVDGAGPSADAEDAARAARRAAVSL